MISTRLQPATYYPQPWDDPNAWTAQPVTNVTAPSYEAPDSGGATKPPNTPTGGSTGTTTDTSGGSGGGGIPSIPDGNGGMTPVPPVTGPIMDPQLPMPTDQNPVPWEAPPPVGPQDLPGAGGGYTGSYPIDPRAGGSGPGWDELNAIVRSGAGGAPAGPNARLLRFQNMSDEALQRILNGPDRLGLARDYYDIFDKETEGDYQRDLKTATNLGAARGRLGSGILTNTYGDLFERRAQDKDATKRRLLTEALEGTIGDRQNAYRAVADAENMAFGEDTEGRNQARADVNQRLSAIDQYFRTQGQAYDDAFRERQYGDDLAYRGRQEERSDRQYSSDRAQQDLLNRIRQQELELDQRRAEWDRAYQLWQMGLGPRPEGSRPGTSTAR